MILLYTCALLWWTLEPENLSNAAAIACKKIDSKGGAISSISIWKIGIKLKKGTLNIGLSIEEYVKRLKSLGTLEIIPVDEDIWVKSIKLDWNHKDPADRAIVATATLRDVPVVTKDSTIRDFYPKTIW